MYTPKHFEMRESALIHDLIEQWSFATLVTSAGCQLAATHLPFLLDRDRGSYGTLISHMARANDQWRAFGDGEVLVLFQGPHAYISPSWYTVQPSVPTWNYTAVHGYGVPTVLDDYARVVEILRETVAKYERAFEQPWPMDLPEAYLRKMVSGIVAFEIELTRVEGKRKLSQNRSREDRRRVAEALDQSEGELQRAVAEMMRDDLCA